MHDVSSLGEAHTSRCQSHHQAIEAEFERRKRLHTGQSDSVVRVAAFLIAVSRQNQHEGGDTAIVCDSLQYGAIADLLGLDPGKLSLAILRLCDLGLIERDGADRLRLRDIEGIERLIHCARESAKPRSDTAIRIRIPHRPILAESLWSQIVGELRELTWLFFFLAGLSIVSVGIGMITAMAMF